MREMHYKVHVGRSSSAVSVTAVRIEAEFGYDWVQGQKFALFAEIVIVIVWSTF
jgi:hypothetical protein